MNAFTQHDDIKSTYNFYSLHISEARNNICYASTGDPKKTQHDDLLKKFLVNNNECPSNGNSYFISGNPFFNVLYDTKHILMPTNSIKMKINFKTIRKITPTIKLSDTDINLANLIAESD